MSSYRHERLLRVLAHPAILVALAALALNDFVLRRAWPSWFTGKLGDFVWLFAAPLVVAVLFALLIDALRCERTRRQPAACSSWVDLAEGRANGQAGRTYNHVFFTAWNMSGATGFALIGGIFALAKTIPACNALVNATAGALFGFPVAWRRDPTDLVALLALLPAWKLWNTGHLWRSRDRFIRGRLPVRRPAASYPLSRPAAGRYLAWLVVPVSMLLTMADSPQPRGDPGVYCLGEQNGAVLARTGTGDYLSRDGGLSWELAPTPTPEPTWTPVRATATATTPIEAIPVVALPGRAELSDQATLGGGKTGLAAPRPLALEGAAQLESSAPGAAPRAALTTTVPLGTSQALTTTAEVTPTLDAASAAQATLDASPMFIPHCAPRNPVADPNRPQIMYRYQQEKVIEHSEDGGRTWVTEFLLQPLTESERQTYAQGHNPSSYTGDNTKSVFPPRPLDALIDAASGNALFAMGHQGVLVRSAAGQWWWVALGRYRHLRS